jgi:hypothetical protein
MLTDMDVGGEQADGNEGTEEMLTLVCLVL